MTRPASTPDRLAVAMRAVVAGVWLALVAVPPVMFLRWRESRLAEVSGAGAQEEWDRFRADMRAEAEGQGPVRRKVPRSAEPPERVWLRDYPGVVVAAWVLFVGLLGAVVGFMLCGAIGAASRAPRVNDRESAAP